MIAPYLKVRCRYFEGLGDVTELFRLVEVPITIRLLKPEAGVLNTQHRLSMNIVDIMLCVFR